MQFNYAAFAVPAFFIFVGLEYVVAIRKKKAHYFSFDSSIANMTIGIAERLMSLFVSVSFYGLFYYIYTHYSLFKIPNHWTVWIILLLATDLVWYWYHRLGHEINILWGAHIVHHQSEEFNYTVSARITVFQSLIRNLFWCILPFVGFHPSQVLTMLLVHGTYSFFTHTRLIGNLGWLEYVFITPSHHRVHHGSNEKYINKNYGDLFVFWDKMFGTFQIEEEEPSYGLTHPIESYSFAWQHFHYFMELLEASRGVKGVKAKFKVFFGRPEDIDQNIRKSLEGKFFPHKGSVKPTLRFKAYLTIQIIASVTVLFLFTLLSAYADTIETVLISISIVITLVNCGALLELRRWIYYLEYIRLILIAGLVSYEINSPELFVFIILAVLVTVASLPVQRWYMKFVYDINK